MNIFDKQVITLYRGNSAEVLITLTDRDTGEPITIETDDKVLFTAKKGPKTIQKVLTVENISPDDQHSLILTIEPEETVIPTGEYPYDVLLITHDNKAITCISSTLVIKPAVGLYTDVGGDGE